MNVAIILAAGKSSRAGQDKLLAEDTSGLPLWTYSYQTFLNHPEIDQIVLVVSQKNKSKFKKYIGGKTELVTGGKTRIESFKNGLGTLKLKDSDIVLDHNAANPFVSKKEISALIKETKKHGAAALSLQCVDTVISVQSGYYSKFLDRGSLRLMQTPQAAQAKIIRKIIFKDQTDLTSAIIPFHKVKIVEANFRNKKITFPADIASFQSNSFIGEDSHEFSKTGSLVLAGLKIKSLPALKANSDGDVVLHALGRALAQVKNLSFSDIADRLCKKGNKNSIQYIKPLLKDIEIVMLSISLECSRPKIDNLPIKQSLAKILKISEDKIRISAHTGEGLDTFAKGIRCSLILTCICK